MTESGWPWQLLRLASPQLPIGGYSYSQGLEAAIEAGQVKDADSAHHWLDDQLHLNLARFDGPLLLALCQAVQAGDWALAGELDERFRVSRESQELRLECRQTGHSLVQLITGLNELDAAASAFIAGVPEPSQALGWALAARSWRISPPMALSAWLWSWLENQLAVLMKALPLGQQSAQALASRLLPSIEQAQQQAAALPADDWGGAPIGLALVCMAHEHQYSRLFRS